MLGVLVGTLVGASVTNRNLPEISLRAGDLVVPTNWDNDILIGFITVGYLVS